MIFAIYEPSRGKIFLGNNQILTPRAVLGDRDFASQILRLREKNTNPWILFFFIVCVCGKSSYNKSISFLL